MGKSKFWSKIKEWWKGYLAWGETLQEMTARRCPKCGSTNLNTLKPGLLKQNSEAWLQLFTLGIRKPTSPLNVCRSCGFSWEDR